MTLPAHKCWLLFFAAVVVVVVVVVFWCFLFVCFFLSFSFPPYFRHLLQKKLAALKPIENHLFVGKLKE